MAAAAGAGDIVILDDYSATVIRFLDADSLPRIVNPGAPISDVATGARVWALSRDDLRQALGSSATQRASVLAEDARGSPRVWVVAPSAK